MTITAGARLLHLIAAAARLAALYGVGVLLLLTALVFWTGDWVGNLRGILMLHGSVFGFLFAAAFVLLAAARRMGFAALWLLVIALWVWLLDRVEWRPVWLLAVFVLWTVVVLPLYCLGAVGFPGRTVMRLRRRTVTVPAIVLALWVLLLLITLAVTPPSYMHVASAVTGSFGAPPAVVLALAPVVWAPVPLLISVEAIWRLYQSTPDSSSPRSSDA